VNNGDQIKELKEVGNPLIVGNPNFSKPYLFRKFNNGYDK